VIAFTLPARSRRGAIAAALPAGSGNSLKQRFFLQGYPSIEALAVHLTVCRLSQSACQGQVPKEIEMEPIVIRTGGSITLARQKNRNYGARTEFNPSLAEFR